VLVALVVATAGFAVAAAGAGDNDRGKRGKHATAGGFTTSQAAMLACPTCGANIVPIITVGDTVGSYQFESIPDGISIDVRRKDGKGHDDRGWHRGHGKRSFDLYVNHETSTVPFPFNPPFAASQGEANQNDFDNSQLSRLTLNGKKQVTAAEMVITSPENFQRFCSNYLATKKEGFQRPLLFTNEEAQDWVFRTGTAWPGPNLITPGTAGAEQTGVVVAYDPRTGKRKPIYGMGRYNHENSVAVPGYRKKNVVLSTDDTFFTTPITTTGPPQNLTYNTKAWSQLYSYIARDTKSIWKDKGDLWAFVSDTAGYDDYYDFTPGDTTKITGHFIKVPKAIATGKNPATGKDWLSTDFPGMLPPPAGGTVGPPPDGPQWVLDQWGNASNNSYNENVFRFVRLEDLAYDKRPGKSNVLYLIDSGRGTAGAPGANVSTNGRVWKMVLNKKDPTKVDSMEILIEGDDAAVKTLAEIHQPDNLESTKKSLLITEDPGSSQQFPFGSSDSAATTARLWKYDLKTGAMAAVASIDQTADEGPTDVDGTPGVVSKSNLGSWEASGIIDASNVLGKGWFLITVQAHTLWIQKQDGPDAISPPNGKDFTFKREGGQLLAIKIPGA
jgi:hypothetical protein